MNNGGETNEGFLPDSGTEVGESTLDSGSAKISRRGFLGAAVAGVLGAFGLTWLVKDALSTPTRTPNPLPTPGKLRPDPPLPGQISPEAKATDAAIKDNSLHAGDPERNPINKAAIENLGQSAPTPISPSTPQTSK